ncbi:rhamnosyltransferase [Roseivirga pacifica]|uniref:Rhamnosyltransferase n=1 Tax=Roseivirga pacifica TaxID=1267423 RepID=A0A1I0N826_9BACT|nr:glycosyltransferase [Roseivirga pacifica]RKQ50976.1 rhamnosyltransferase [Roseivirga pacifica]SEV96984.1 rhamnosyltransferase [Roseivirga pacifica]
MSSKVTVVMITYNGHQFFKEQADSILNQSYKPYLLYIQDDCSNPDFQNDLLAYSVKQRDKLMLNILNKNVGVIENIKSAIASNSDTSLIALSDQDDIWKKDKLQAVVSKIEAKSGLDHPLLVYHDAEIIDKNGKVILPSFWAYLGQNWYEHRLETFLFGNFITGSTMVFNQALANYSKDIPTDLETLHDAWLGLCAFCFGEVVQIKKPLNRYRHHGNNVAFKELKTKNTPLFSKIRNWLTDRQLLNEEGKMVERFLQVYKEELSQDKQAQLIRFLRLTKRPPIFRRIVKSIVLRKYRL